MSQPYKYAIVFERSSDGFGTYVPDLPGCISVGDTLEETETLIREAIAGHLAVMTEVGETIPAPTTLTGYVEVPIAVGQ